MPLVEIEECFDSLQAEQCTEREVASGGWHSQGPTRTQRWHPTAWQSTARLSMSCLHALGSQQAADHREAWQPAGSQPLRWGSVELIGRKLR